MKKISTILITIVIWLVFLILIGRFTSSFVDPIGMPIFNYEYTFIHSNLIDLGNFSLAIVFVLTKILQIAIILVLIPYLSYHIAKLDFDKIKKLKLLGIPTAIVIVAICLLTITGVQLRNLSEELGEKSKQADNFLKK